MTGVRNIKTAYLERNFCAACNSEAQCGYPPGKPGMSWNLALVRGKTGKFCLWSTTALAIVPN